LEIMRRNHYQTVIINLLFLLISLYRCKHLRESTRPTFFPKCIANHKIHTHSDPQECADKGGGEADTKERFPRHSNSKEIAFSLLRSNSCLSLVLINNGFQLHNISHPILILSRDKM
jgi:hypothetical protein